MSTKTFNELLAIYIDPAIEKESREKFLEQIIQLTHKCILHGAEGQIAQEAYLALEKKCSRGIPIEKEESVKMLEQMNLYPWSNEETSAQMSFILCTLIIASAEQGKTNNWQLDKLQSDVDNSMESQEAFGYVVRVKDFALNSISNVLNAPNDVFSSDSIRASGTDDLSKYNLDNEF